MIAAHALLRREEPNTPPLVLAGAAGWDDVEFNPDDVVWPGYLPQAELRALTAGAAALVLPSRYEGFGLPALEALACGVPVVASDIPVLREVTGGLAQYVPVGDVEALAATLRITLEADDVQSRRAPRMGSHLHLGTLRGANAGRLPGGAASAIQRTRDVKPHTTP